MVFRDWRDVLQNRKEILYFYDFHSPDVDAVVQQLDEEHEEVFVCFGLLLQLEEALQLFQEGLDKDPGSAAAYVEKLEQLGQRLALSDVLEQLRGVYLRDSYDLLTCILHYLHYQWVDHLRNSCLHVFLFFHAERVEGAKKAH